MAGGIVRVVLVGWCDDGDGWMCDERLLRGIECRTLQGIG